MQLLEKIRQDANSARWLGILALMASLMLLSQLWTVSALKSRREIVVYSPELREAWRSHPTEAP